MADLPAADLHPVLLHAMEAFDEQGYHGASYRPDKPLSPETIAERYVVLSLGAVGYVGKPAA